MVDLDEVMLDAAKHDDASVLSNLLELYIHDLSAVFALDLAADGRFGYERLPLYWSETERRFPFLIRYGHHIAGFALITRGSPASNNPDDFDVSEFFVLRRYRRLGIGRHAAFMLWNQFAAPWVIRVAESNNSGLEFWSNAVAEYTSNHFTKTIRPGGSHLWHVFSFINANRCSDQNTH